MSVEPPSVPDRTLEAVALGGLEPVVVGTEPGQFVELGPQRDGPVLGVVDLQVVPRRATGDLAAVAAGVEGGALVGGRLPAEVGVIRTHSTRF